MLAIALPIKFTLSKLFNSSAEIGTGSSKIIPSTTQTGSRFPEIEEAPRIRTFGAAPGVEVGLIIFTPANFPCNILSIEIAAPSCNSDPFTPYEYPDETFENIITPFSFPELRQKAKFAAIPSTSGTATEVTAFSVITDYNTGIKYPLADFNITPDVAIVDPELVEGLPQKQVAYTGMDALTHAIEAYVSTLNCPFTDPLALQAIEMVLDYLPASYNLNMEAREQMHYAQCLAGMAFSNALLGIVHSMAHKTGAAFSTGHIPHGCANAIYLPYVIKYNAKDKVAASRYAEIARRMGLPGTSEKALINSLCAKIDEFNAKMNIPKTLKEFGINEEEFKEKLDKIAELAVGDACTGSNPRAIDPATMAKLFTCTYYGTEVDF